MYHLVTLQPRSVQHRAFVVEPCLIHNAPAITVQRMFRCHFGVQSRDKVADHYRLFTELGTRASGILAGAGGATILLRHPTAILDVIDLDLNPRCYIEYVSPCSLGGKGTVRLCESELAGNTQQLRDIAARCDDKDTHLVQQFSVSANHRAPGVKSFVRACYLSPGSNHSRHNSPGLPRGRSAFLLLATAGELPADVTYTSRAKHRKLSCPSQFHIQPAQLDEEHCTLARAGDEHLNAKTRLGKVKEMAGIAERRMEGARLCEAELVASSSHQKALGRARSAAHLSSETRLSKCLIDVRFSLWVEHPFSLVGHVKDAFDQWISRGTPVSVTSASRHCTICISLSRHHILLDYSSPSEFSHEGIVRDDAIGRRVFSGTSRFLRPFIPALLHTPLAVKSRPNLFTRSRLHLWPIQITLRQLPLPGHETGVSQRDDLECDGAVPICTQKSAVQDMSRRGNVVRGESPRTRPGATFPFEQAARHSPQFSAQPSQIIDHHFYTNARRKLRKVVRFSRKTNYRPSILRKHRSSLLESDLPNAAAHNFSDEVKYHYLQHKQHCLGITQHPLDQNDVFFIGKEGTQLSGGTLENTLFCANGVYPNDSIWFWVSFSNPSQLPLGSQVLELLSKLQLPGNVKASKR
ncbi:hypothetical protein PR048_009549 [Dryococelus australis]|uniref:Uncharacterized protein n=1 Tax=Dryococelus australis TaxID=614101 RepID=A0ABQ9I0A3_9NEOP|nr:hypothetical protein PR048_009549 [Dryococelus australis]